MTQENSIKSFYSEKEIFLTGGTGFVGKFLIEKLLRSCTDLKKIFVLIRSKRGKNSQERIKTLLEHSLFDKIRSLDPNILNKVQAIDGDCMELRLGISSENFENMKNVSVIFHCAASVRFEDILQKVILLHARGSREVCKFAENLKNLKCLVHVSTAYSNPSNDVTDETVYPTEFHWGEYIEYAENYDSEILGALEKKLIGDFPNTYSFTKNLAENVCKYYSAEKKLPIVIYRPSIVSSAEIEPEQGWIDSMNGAMALMFAFTSGLCRTLRGYKDSGMDLIPVDICVKGIIIAAWKKWKDTEVKHQPDKLDVYNCAALKFIGLFELLKYGRVVTSKHPFKYMLWRPNIFVTSNSSIATLNFYVTQLLPSLILDFVLKLFNQKPRVMDALRKLTMGLQGGKVFIEHHTEFKNEKFKALDDELLECDQPEFFLLEVVKSKAEYIDVLHNGMLKHWFQQSEEETKEARQRYKIMVVVDFIVSKTVYFVVFYYLMKLIFNVFFNKFLV